MGKLGHITRNFKSSFLAVFTAIFAFSALLTTFLAPNVSADDNNEECFSNGGSVSWVACPVTEYIARGQDGIFTALKSFLEVDTRFFSNDNTSTFAAWAIFRNIANVLLVIILLIIIFSQVTGVGIDNYGVKRALPRLIAIAIIVNLSYILCQLAVDLSNIVGTSVDKLLDGIGQGIKDAAIAAADTSRAAEITELASSSILTIALVILGGAASAAATAAPAIAGLVGGASGASIWILLIPLIIMLVVALVAVLMFFIMLGARQLLAVICVAISPIAIACYVLPNTQSLGKKWLDTMKAVLVVFPVCSALYGASQLAKMIVAVSPGVHLWILMAAHIAAVLPYFAAPSLIKKALNAIGNAGAVFDRISNGVRNAGRNAQNAVRQSDRYKHAQSQAAIGFNKARLNGRPLSENRRTKLQNRINELSRRQANGETLSDRDSKRLKNARDTIEGDGNRGLGAKQRKLEQDADVARLTALDDKLARGEVLSADELKEQKRLRKSKGKLDAVNDNIGRLRMANIAETKNQKKISSYASANKERAAISNMESQLEEERISDQMSLIASGGYTYGNNQSLNVDSLDDLEKALTYESGENGSVENAMAIMRTLESKGDDGMDRVSRVLNSGKATNQTIRTRMARAVVNSGKYKTGTRSTHVAAQQMLDNPGSYRAGMVDEVRNSGNVLGKYKTDNIPDMTDSEFDNLVDNYSGTPHAAQAANLMNAALSDDRVRNRLKSGQIDRMEKAIQAAGISPATKNGIPVGPAASGAPLQVNNSGSSAPAPAPTIVNADHTAAPAQSQVVNAHIQDQAPAASQTQDINIQRQAELDALRNPDLTAEQVRSIFNQNSSVAQQGPVQVHESTGTDTASGSLNRTVNTHTDTTAEEVVNQNVNRHETTTTSRQVEQNINNEHTETIHQNVNTQSSSEATVTGTSEAAATDAARTAIENATQSAGRRDRMTATDAANHLDQIARNRDAANRNADADHGGIILPH